MFKRSQLKTAYVNTEVHATESRRYLLRQFRNMGYTRTPLGTFEIQSQDGERCAGRFMFRSFQDTSRKTYPAIPRGNLSSFYAHKQSLIVIEYSLWAPELTFTLLGLTTHQTTVTLSGILQSNDVMYSALLTEYGNIFCGRYDDLPSPKPQDRRQLMETVDEPGLTALIIRMEELQRNLCSIQKK